ncbi:MAG: T3SS effector HopA1 family protein [bacterium]|nr:T3SS effector HopA1 family protein [bacterium]
MVEKPHITRSNETGLESQEMVEVSKARELAGEVSSLINLYVRNWYLPRIASVEERADLQRRSDELFENFHAKYYNKNNLASLHEDKTTHVEHHVIEELEHFRHEAQSLNVEIMHAYENHPQQVLQNTVIPESNLRQTDVRQNQRITKFDTSVEAFHRFARARLDGLEPFAFPHVGIGEEKEKGEQRREIKPLLTVNQAQSEKADEGMREWQKGISSETEQHLASFRWYAAAHHDDIEDRLKKGEKLDDIFYSDFYNRDIDNLTYHASDIAVLRVKESYKELSDQAQEDLTKKMWKDAEKGRKDFIPWVGDGWFYCDINGGPRRDTGDIGRFYLNVNIEKTPELYAKSVEAFRKAGLHVQIKMPCLESAQDNDDILNKADKMMIFFNAREERQALRELENLYHNNSALFTETGIPRFTAVLPDASGEIMAGVGFGEEPLLYHQSFGMVRAKILAEVYHEASSSGRPVLDPSFDFDASFRLACRKYRVDPEHPTFNESDGSQKFMEIKKRMAQ